MYGEYKVLGGKFVVVDFEIEDDWIVCFCFVGDFFFEFDLVLDDINEVVNGFFVEFDVIVIVVVVCGVFFDGV